MTSATPPDDAELFEKMARAKARAEDWARYNDAIAGRETGHGSRHQRGHDDETRSDSDRKENCGVSALDIALQDDAYAVLYHDISEFMRETAERVESALEAAMALAEQEDDRLRSVLLSASTLPDGTHVFRDSTGGVFDEFGRETGSNEAESIVWKDGAPSYEEFQERKRAAEIAARQVRDLTDLQADIADAQVRISDPHDPVSEVELRDIQSDIQKRSDALLENQESEGPKATTHQLSAKISVPEIDF